MTFDDLFTFKYFCMAEWKLIWYRTKIYRTKIPLFWIDLKFIKSYDLIKQPPLHIFWKINLSDVKNNIWILTPIWEFCLAYLHWSFKSFSLVKVLPNTWTKNNLARLIFLKFWQSTLWQKYKKFKKF